MSQNSAEKSGTTAKSVKSKPGTIRLADLLTRKNVSGGGKVIFGGSYSGVSARKRQS